MLLDRCILVKEDHYVREKKQILSRRLKKDREEVTMELEFDVNEKGFSITECTFATAKKMMPPVFIGSPFCKICNYHKGIVHGRVRCSYQKEDHNE
jgi:hypothetical protein